MNNAVIGKTIENVRKHRNIILVTTERRFVNIRLHIRLSILDLSKTVIYEFWYDYVKPKYGENAKLCYMDRDSFIVHVKTDDIYKDIAEDIETRFDTSNFETDKPLPKGKNKKVIGLMKECECVIKTKLKFQNYENCLEAARAERIF